jgi:phosphoglycolate phosphatase
MPLFSSLGFSPRLVMFDLDGTLVDSIADIALALNRALLDIGLPPVTDAQVQGWVGRGASRLMYCVLENEGRSPALHDALLARFMARYQESVCEASTVYAGARELVLACKAAGIHLACVTNKPYAPAKALLVALDLLEPFDVLLGGDTLAHKKPHPEPLLHCLRHFEVAAADALMVGDSRNDIEAAHAAHVRVVAVPYGYNHGEPIAAAKPDWLVESLAVLL